MKPTPYTRALGARLLSEANDIKRTPESLASELGMPAGRIQEAIAGELSPEDYHALFQSVAKRYPISFNRLWLDLADTQAGILHMTAAESEASSRTFARADRTGKLTPYYEYRDTAFSRTSPFRPEWIKQLRVVRDSDPMNPDVAYNKGHFLHQTTLFIGAVNFYWEVDGKRYAMEMDTGDSNYITPFWPHSFTSRDASRPAFVVAVTYGGEAARAREELARIGPDGLSGLTLDLRREAVAYAALLRRHLAHEAVTEDRFADMCVQRRLDAGRVAAFLSGRAVPSAGDLGVMAEILHVTPRDLMPPTRSSQDEVVMLRRAQAETYPYPDAANATYEITQLARSRQQPYLKSFLIRVLSGRKGAEFRLGLHQYVYNYGDAGVRVFSRSGDGERMTLLAPGDSAYLAPMASVRFEAESARPGDLYLVRIPGALHPDAVFELSGMAPDGSSRAAGETTRWF